MTSSKSPRAPAGARRSVAAKAVADTPRGPEPTRDVMAAAPLPASAAGGAALQTADQVRAVAHLLSDAADAYNQRLKAEAATLSSGQVFARLQEEQRLRGVANQLYFEATDRTLAEAVEAQDTLEATLRDAHQKLLKFQQFQHTLALVADLLVLAGAIVARKGSTVIAALKEVRADLKAPVTDDA